MRRWHQERSLILRRWAEEKRNHMEDERVFGPKHSFEHCHCSGGPGLMRKARPGDRPPDFRWHYRFHRQEVAHSNKERGRHDRAEVAAQLQMRMYV